VEEEVLAEVGFLIWLWSTMGLVGGGGVAMTAMEAGKEYSSVFIRRPYRQTVTMKGSNEKNDIAINIYM
jgi:hypothetical protein